MKKKRKNIFKYWEFGAILICIILIIVTIIVMITNTIDRKKDKTIENEYTNVTENKLNNGTKTEGIITESPYMNIQDYDGLYQFYIDDDNGNGYKFYARGIIAINNGTCDVKYQNIAESLKQTTDKTAKGYCGLDRNTGKYCLMLLDNNNKIHSLYECTKNENKVECKMIRGYNLAGCSGKYMQLECIDNSNGLHSAYLDLTGKWCKEDKEKEETKAKKEESDFKNDCKVLKYKDLARNPSEVKGTNVKITGKVIQVIEGSYYNSIRLNITKGNYGYYSDTIYVTYTQNSGGNKILEDDIITIWGTAEGDYLYTSIMGATITLPKVTAKYLNID